MFIWDAKCEITAEMCRIDDIRKFEMSCEKNYASFWEQSERRFTVEVVIVVVWMSGHKDYVWNPDAVFHV